MFRILASSTAVLVSLAALARLPEAQASRSLRSGQAGPQPAARTSKSATGQKTAGGDTGATTPHAGPATLDLAKYLAELDRWSAATARLERHPEEAAQLENDLPDSWSVTIDGEHFSVPTDWLRQTLVSLEANHWLAGDYSKEIRARLDFMRAQAQALGREPALHPETARNRLDGILERREFAGLRGPSRFDQLSARVIAWLADLIARVFGRLQARPAVSRVLTWTLAIALVLIVTAWLVRAFLRRRPEEVTLNLKGGIRVSRGWRDWARDALAASARGNHRDAIRLAYWAGVYRLEELGLCKVDRTRTHREYLRLLGVAPGAESRRAPLENVTWRFERVWYGREPASAEDFQFVIEQLEMLGCVFPSTPATGSS